MSAVIAMSGGSARVKRVTCAGSDCDGRASHITAPVPAAAINAVAANGKARRHQARGGGAAAGTATGSTARGFASSESIS